MIGPIQDMEFSQLSSTTNALGYVWDVATLSWQKAEAASGGGGAVTVADGADVAQGSVSDPAWTSGDGTVIGLLKKIASPGAGGLTDAELRATPVPVSGTITAIGTVTANQGTSSANDWRTDLRRGQTLAFAPIDVASSGDNTIVAADGTRKVKVLSYAIVADAAVSARWKSGAGTSLSGAMSLAANGGLAEGAGNSPATQWLFETAVNQALVLNLSAAVGARGRVSYFLEA